MRPASGNTSTLFIELRKTCSPWPEMEAGSFGCTRRTSRDNGKSLDSSIDISEKSKCAQLCLQQEGSGCCELNRDIGCYWREGESAKGVDSGSGTAVTCSFVQGCLISTLSQ